MKFLSLSSLPKSSWFESSYVFYSNCHYLIASSVSGQDDLNPTL